MLIMLLLRRAVLVKPGCKTDVENKSCESRRRSRSTFQNLYLHCRNPVIITDLSEERKRRRATFESIILPKHCKCQISVSLFTVIYQLDETNVHTGLLINNIH